MGVEDKQTLCHILKGNQLLLKRASRGISIGNWNAPGGKLEYEGEPPEECVYREVFEETGLKVKNLFKHGVINFHFEGKKILNITVHLYSTKDFEGEIKVKEGEDEVRWFDVDKIPLENMWEDDLYWLDLMLRRRKFNADFYFDQSKKITRYSIVFID